MNYEFPIRADSYAAVNARKEQVLEIAKADGFIIYELVARICDPEAKLNDLPLMTRELKWTYWDLTRPRGMWLNNKDLPNKSLWLMEPSKKDDRAEDFFKIPLDQMDQLWARDMWLNNETFSDNRKRLRKCTVTRNKKTEKCYFHAWGQHYTPTNKPDGSFIGQVLGIVEHIDGQIEEVKPKSIKFEEWGDDNGSEIG